MRHFAWIVLAAALPMAALASETYKLKLWQPSVVAGKELKPGDYKMTVEEGKIVLSDGKTSVESPAKVETADRTFRTSSVRYDTASGKAQVVEIHVGRTNTKVILPAEGAAMAAGNR